MPPKNHKRGTPTLRQIEIVQFYRALPDDCARQTITASHFGISSANVLKARRAFERNSLLVMGFEVPDLKDLMKHGACSNDNEQGGLVNIVRMASQHGVTIDDGSMQSNAFPNSFLETPVDGEPCEDAPEPRDVFLRGHQTVKRRSIVLPTCGVLRLFVTTAQDGISIHEGFWKCLNNYLEWCQVNSGGAGAELVVSGFTYNKKTFGASHEKKDATFLASHELHNFDDNELGKIVYFDSRIEQHWSEEHIEVGELLDICAESNTQPTAVNPLSGFQTYTGGRWGIFPHVKHQLESIARMPGKPYKANVTTGACTPSSYVAKKAGQKAEMHHTIGFTIIEVMPNGRIWVRTIAASAETGAFHDVDRYIDQEGVHEGQTVATISYGDVHHEKVDPDIARVTWGYDPEEGRTVAAWRKKSLLDKLKPSHQFFHDVSDFAPRNHHNIDDPHFLAATYFRQESSVEHELKRVAIFLTITGRPWCQSVVVQSNHDNAFLKWVKTADVRRDPENAELFHRSNARIYKGLRDHGREPPIFEITLRELSGKGLNGVMFIDEQDSYVVHEIEHSQHGHLGANGSRGSPLGLSKIAPKMTTGHTHSPSIRDGLFTSGVCQMEMGYNRGPSSWALAHTIGHHDGNRQILFYNEGAFYAGQ